MNILKLKKIFYLLITLVSVGVLVTSCQKESILETPITSDLAKVDDPELQMLLDLDANELSSRINNPKCHPDDFKALKALYNSTNGDSWVRVYRSWDVVANNNGPTASCDLGTIQGVFLYKNGSTLGTPGRVQTLQLNNMNLTGTLPWQLYYLREIGSLNLYDNNITGGIQRYIGYLPKLTNLDLRRNELTGTIPSALYRLRPRFFLLDDNQLSGSVTPGIGNFEFATWIGLSNNNFSGCYPSDMQDICGVQFKYIDGGNNFDVPFSSFCSSGSCN